MNSGFRQVIRNKSSDSCLKNKLVRDVVSRILYLLPNIVSFHTAATFEARNVIFFLVLHCFQLFGRSQTSDILTDSFEKQELTVIKTVFSNQSLP